MAHCNKVFLLVLVITACDKSGDSVTMISGHENAVVGDTLYVPVIWKGDENDFYLTGKSVRAWACGDEISDMVITNGTEIKTRSAEVRLDIMTPEQVMRTCGHNKVGGACTTIGEGACEMHISCDPIQSDGDWGHEFQHCLCDCNFH